MPVFSDFTSSLLDGDKPGIPVVRSDDMVALRIELVNLEVVPGPPPVVRKTASGPAWLVLHFPPQAIGEQVFFQAAQPSRTGGAADETVDTPQGPVAGGTSGNGKVDPPPILARMAGESRIAFEVPDRFEAPYTLAGLLNACQWLSLSVPANAPPRGARPPGGFWQVVVTKVELEQLSPRLRLGLNRFNAHLQSATQQADGTAPLRMLRAPLGVGGWREPSPHIDHHPDIGGLLSGARPAEPSARQTAIELPWRLVLSPHTGERFNHATQPVTADASKRTELWHTRLVLPDADGWVSPVQRPDANRTVRAVYARTDDTLAQMKPAFPKGSDLPAPSSIPFLAAMDDNDRFQIAHLSSNFSRSSYQPQPIQADRLMLSPLGGWLDARGAWEPPGLDVEEWVNHATMGRDHYVCVVYRGVLCCFGHRVSLVKVTERKFHNGRNGTSVQPGNAAYLRQRLFLVIRERERDFVEPGLVDARGRVLHNQFPFTKVRILTTVTPDLDPPDSPESRIKSFNDRRMFWPCVGGEPFRFDCVGEDLEGRQVAFSLPLIFLSNSLASPRIGQNLAPDYATAETAAQKAADEWMARTDRRNARDVPRRRADLLGQSVAFAPSLTPGDTSAPVEAIDFGVRAGNLSSNSDSDSRLDLRGYSQKLTRPIFFPTVDVARVRLPAIAQLSGGRGTNLLSWHLHYLQHGYVDNPGEVFMEVDAVTQAQPPANVVVAGLDFSKQSDRSGGFAMPNLKPSAWSRMAGPVSGNAEAFRSGSFEPTNAFPSAAGALGDLPLPLLFGCIPLGEVIDAVGDFAGGAGKLPKFVAEAGNRLDAFLGEMARVYDLVQRIASNPGSVASAAIAVARATVADLLAQTTAFATAQAAPAVAALQQLDAALDTLSQAVAPLVNQKIADAKAPDLSTAGPALQAALAQLATSVNDASALPAGFRQAVRTLASQADVLILDVLTLTPILTAGQQLFEALRDVIDIPPGSTPQLSDLLESPALFKPRLEAVRDATQALRNAVAGARLLDGAPAKSLLQALDAVLTALGLASDLLQLLEALTGEELVVRFDWTPALKSWALPGSSVPIFRANDPNGFTIAVEARIKRSGGAPKVGVLCSLKHFDLVLIAPASFIELNFEKIEFTVDSNAKTNVDVVLTDIKFVGVLSFVETLRDLIPLDGFSDPPSLDISAKGIDASFSVALPAISVGMFNLSNLSLGAGFTVPFIGQPLAVRFNFCTREQPFNLSVMVFGGGGFFGITLDPHGVQILEASFEFGASLSVNFGVASGGVHVMAGIYFRMEANKASLTGYFRLGGHVSVLGLISASIELYLELEYVFDTGKCRGMAQLTIEVSVFLFSGSVTITCERTFAGSNGDPTFRQELGFRPALALADELAVIGEDTEYAWREYCEAFA
ncbi:hypothetical protein G7048_25715 (plasmid) [Diaphorobacter sp. HDW4B]|nr:hypothetical protein G7048_25715 [Diaphorobacter sp. HDW4B]